MPPEKVYRKFGNKMYRVQSFYRTKARAQASANFGRKEHGAQVRIVPGVKNGKKGYYTYVRGGKGKTWKLK